MIVPAKSSGNLPLRITPKPRRMTIIVPSTVNGKIRIEAEKHKVKPYYLVSAALALWCGLCSVCGLSLQGSEVDPSKDILIRCTNCRTAGKVPDRVLGRTEGDV